MHPIKKYYLSLLYIVVAVLFMSLEYASINSLSRDINGKIIANVQDGIFITDVLYEFDVDVQDYKINKIHQNVLHSNVNLTGDNAKDQVTFDEFLLIDLTGIFGADNEPSEEWCKENIKYVEDSEYIYVNY